MLKNIEANKVFSVAKLNEFAKTLLEEELGSVFVTGELSNVSMPSSGHLYFTLKDSFAQVRCALFRSHARNLKFKPEEGQKVIIKAQVSLYAPRGDYQLIVTNMELAGLGLLWQQYEQLKNKLDAQGLFADEHKKPIPLYPKTVALITSQSGAVIHDMINIFNRRNSGILLRLYPCQVQGEKAHLSIIKALQLAAKEKTNDVLVIARGGGSLEDLWCFNNEKLAHAIFDCKKPIISAVGHETDFTICDFVASQRAPTPSAAAEILSPLLSEMLATLDYYKQQLSNIILRTLNNKEQQLDYLIKALKHPQAKITELELILDGLYKTLTNNFKNLVSNKENKLNILIKALHTLSPLNTMTRGYSVVYNAKKQVVTNANNLKVNDSIHIKMLNGEVDATIITK